MLFADICGHANLPGFALFHLVRGRGGQEVSGQVKVK